MTASLLSSQSWGLEAGSNVLLGSSNVMANACHSEWIGDREKRPCFPVLSRLRDSIGSTARETAHEIGKRRTSPYVVRARAAEGSGTGRRPDRRRQIRREQILHIHRSRRTLSRDRGRVLRRMPAPTRALR